MHTTTEVSGADVSAPKPRMSFFDAVRGFSVISMVLFHLSYDLRFIYGIDLAFFHPPFMDIWRASISWTFLFVAGCMCSFSRNNLKRSLRYLGVAAAVFVVTTIVAVDDPINFGIIFCMGGCTLIYHLLDRVGAVPKGPLAACLLFVTFVLLLGVPYGHIGIGDFTATLPHQLYTNDAFAFAGFHTSHFISGDYYPLIPFIFMYLTGAAMGRWWKATSFPAWMDKVHVPALETVGKLALPIYVIHQPAMIAVLELLKHFSII